ncbi:probable sodium/metabolite cotransporter BASS4, chloroplastic [Ipomoea triloba]|uniref:probable sodium/metabolite cotransporter BASS4, chloroplastic n=1 Tax=Ipomoea triloba TaxID=35885 RepID=UPI00125D29A9|nr:probable sodium/metabolite cotransporter BASS4, chloroplastic [Ipomoea triloba]
MAATLRTTSLNLSARASLPSVRRRHYFPATRFPLPGDYSFRIQLNLPLARKYPFITVTPIRAQAKSYRGNGSENQFPEVPAKEYNWVKPILKFASDNFLPIALVCGVALGLANPSLGCLADRYHLSKFSTFGIFIISGLTLRTEEVGAAAEAWPVALFGLASILFLTPLFSKIILLLRLQPQEFITGLAIFCCMPTTLSSGVALTRLAGGNSALALSMTVISSLIGILIIPFSISKLVATGVGVSVPTEQLMRSLVLTLLVPLIVGKVFREIFKSVADFADQNRKLLSMTNSMLLSLAPFIQVSRSRSLLLLVNPAVFLVAVVMGAVLHAMLFAFNAVAIQVLSSISGGSESAFAKKENASALLLVASQKTLPIMVAVAEQLGGGLGETGLLVLPCVAAHLNQIIIDSFIVNFWLQKDRATYNAKVA